MGIGIVSRTEDSTAQQLYTPAMMAGLLKLSPRHIRRWHRMGLLRSIRIAHRIPYFDFEQVQCAKRIASWMALGAKPTSIQRELSNFGRRINDQSLIDLDLVFDGRRLLLRESGKLVGAHGQLHLDFDEADSRGDLDSDSATLSFAERVNAASEDLPRASWSDSESPLSRDDMLAAAEEHEDAGQLEQAIEWYRVILAQHGPHPEIAFQLAELLYRSGDLSAARERYYNAIEIDEDFVEARVNLGCVLAETGQLDLAIAAFQGALARDDHYPDVHYHLARSLDEIGSADKARRHWLRFVQLAPHSPWAEEALDRIGRH
ncbi:MAG: tetratricopeptide repeat protein [Planctomycetota bacterium]|jgi:tetratricopeptide (TPR) repeat protein